MKKTLADMVSKATHLLDGPFADDVKSLRLPAVNHGQELGPRVERYVFGPEELALIDGQFAGVELGALLQGFRTPHKVFWIEVAVPPNKMGFFIRRRAEQVWDVAVYADAHGVVEVVRVGTIAAQDDPPVREAYPKTGFGLRFADRYGWPEPDTLRHAIALTAAIVSPRMATIERRVIGGLAARRRAQRGYPVFSHNVVTLKIPETSLQRGEVRETTTAGGRRSSVVRGHWRLIAWPKDGDPYWTWVAEHKAGDEALGVIVKTRVVKLNGMETRRGFVVPQFAGAPGQRVPARRVS